MTRIALLGLLALAGCADKPTTYFTAAGPKLSNTQFQRVVAICRGRAAQTPTGVVYGDAYDRLAQAIVNSGQRDTAFDGCMAEHGLMVKE